MKIKFKYPELVVPYQEIPLRDRVYKYVLGIALAAIVALAIILVNMRGVC